MSLLGTDALGCKPPTARSLLDAWLLSLSQSLLHRTSQEIQTGLEINLSINALMWKHCIFCLQWIESEGLGSCKNRENKIILYGSFTFISVRQ